MPFKYNAGFGSELQSDALGDALPPFGNNPQKCPYDLYAEQISGTAFTVPRKDNKRTWMYRIQPSVLHAPFKAVEKGALSHGAFVAENGFTVTPNQLRWNPLPAGATGTQWCDGFTTMAGHGDPQGKSGLAIHMYSCDTSMGKRAMYNSDGEMLVVPQEGALKVQTELGWLDVPPGHIAVLPRGLVFRVEVEGPSRGYVLEVFKGHFDLPDLGPIGSNGLANARDFEYPVAAYDETSDAAGVAGTYDWQLVNKFGGKMFETKREGTPFNVVAWHGNYAPYRYDMAKFCCINSVTFDHPDPSIYTVLTCKGDGNGTATADFVIFPPRWMCMDNTFRPPWYHRNCMSEFMGMVWGKYDAKEGFRAGGAR